MTEMYNGEVVWFKKRYGFISWKKDGVPQKDMFIHHSDIDMEGYRVLKAGQKVKFSIGENNSGEPKAVDVKLCEN